MSSELFIYNTAMLYRDLFLYNTAVLYENMWVRITFYRNRLLYSSVLFTPIIVDTGVFILYFLRLEMSITHLLVHVAKISDFIFTLIE